MGRACRQEGKKLRLTIGLTSKGTSKREVGHRMQTRYGSSCRS
jgi:hypothetical protein